MQPTEWGVTITRVTNHLLSGTIHVFPGSSWSPLHSNVGMAVEIQLAAWSTSSFPKPLVHCSSGPFWIWGPHGGCHKFRRIAGPFSIAMLNNQRVYIYVFIRPFFYVAESCSKSSVGFPKRCDVQKAFRRHPPQLYTARWGCPEK